MSCHVLVSLVGLGYASSTRSLTCRILGTPDEDNWPGVTSLPDYKTTFPQWAGVPLPSHIRGLDADGLELLTSMLIYDPAHRMSGESFLFFFFSCLPLFHPNPHVLLSRLWTLGVKDLRIQEGCDE
jgi:hypothetical protein